MGKGKGRRRRRANYLAAHDSHAILPAPPTVSDFVAVPSKLRRIITLKSASPYGHLSKGRDHHPGTRRAKGKQAQKQRSTKQKNASNDRKQEETGNGRDICPSEASEPKQKKNRKWEDELQVLSEKFKATPVHKGLNERKKRYLQEKKNRKKRVTPSDINESNPSLHKQEKISFGEIVEAPPKLSFPTKHTTAAVERLRQQAIETYRERRKWLTRPGSHQPPPLANEAAMSL
ncbi:hypothetical protein GOP47_0009797 [Adiantum capillus-veneris]|uniref:Uncharacterized protein n=1 Tax=Adiantum capillus-veneris TaxID=13818 RepID=A0A9D4UXA2_ADICA|nr:hypothetical protein GOP47_0009797 [Adiantum capillus-veneris]